MDVDLPYLISKRAPVYFGIVFEEVNDHLDLAVRINQLF